MAKRKFKIHFRIPPYRYPRNKWRLKIYEAAKVEIERHAVEYKSSDTLAVKVLLYLSESALEFHDVDNRLKDILDALQGRMGGSKSIHKHKQLIPNDRQIWHVEITKMLPPSQSSGGFGHVIITHHKRT